MSFLIDPFLMFGFGILIALIGKKYYKEDSFLKPGLGILVLLVTFTLSISLFCELNSAQHGLMGIINEGFFNAIRFLWAGYYQVFPNASSCEFMFSSGIVALRPPFDNFAGLANNTVFVFAGIVMFLLYPVWLYLGSKVGVAMFGRKPGDKGFLGIL